MKKFLKFIILPIVILFTNVIKVNALVKPELITTYNYNSPYVYNNFNADFFDTDDTIGYLTDLTMASVSQLNTIHYMIAFSKNDIYFFRNSISNDFYFNIGTYVNNQAINIYPSSGTYFNYWKLSDYSNYSSFKSAVLNNSGTKHRYDYLTKFVLWSGNTDNFMNYDYNYFSDGVTDYIIPFVSNANIYNTCLGSTCYDNSIIYNTISVNGIDTYIPSYFELFGLQKPSKDLAIQNTRVFSLDTLVNVDSTYSVDFKLPKNLSNINLTYKLYTKTEYSTGVSGLYYYKELSNEVSLVNAPSTLTCDNTSCTYTISSSNVVNNSLPSNTLVYIKAILSSPAVVNINSLNYTYTGSVPYFGWYNNLSTDLLSLTLYSNSTNSYLFSANDNNLTSFYYTTYANEDGIYGTPELIRTDNREVVSYNMTSNPVYTFFGTTAQKSQFYYLNYRGISATRGYALNFSMYPKDLHKQYDTWVATATYDFQYNFFISPNLFWSDSQLADDKKSVTGVFINENNEAQNITVEHDFNNKLDDYTGLDFSLEGLQGLFDEDFYGLSGIITAPFNYIKNLNNYTCSNLTIPFPFTNSNIVIPCLSTYYSSIGSLVDIIHIVMYGIVSWFIGKDLFKTIFNAFKPNKNDIEVVDL